MNSQINNQENLPTSGQSPNSTAIILAVLITALVVALGTYFITKNMSDDIDDGSGTAETPEPTRVATDTPEPTPILKTFTQDEIGLKFMYPDTLSLRNSSVREYYQDPSKMMSDALFAFTNDDQISYSVNPPDGDYGLGWLPLKEEDVAVAGVIAKRRYYKEDPVFGSTDPDARIEWINFTLPNGDWHMITATYHKDNTETSAAVTTILKTVSVFDFSRDVSKWEEFKTEEFGFKFKHPREWSDIKLHQIKGPLFSASIYLPNPDLRYEWGGPPGVRVDVSELGDEMTLDKYIDEVVVEDGVSRDFYKFDETTIDGIRAVQARLTTTVSFPNYRLVREKDGKKWLIGIFFSAPLEGADEVQEDILNSFVFF